MLNYVINAKIGNTLPLPRVELFGLITVIAVAETGARVHSEWETLMLGSNFRSPGLGMEHGRCVKEQGCRLILHAHVGLGSVTVLPCIHYAVVLTGNDFPSAEALWFPVLLLEQRDTEQPCSGRRRPASQLVAELLA